MLKTVDAFMLRTVVHKGTADILHTGYQFNIDNKNHNADHALKNRHRRFRRDKRLTDTGDPKGKQHENADCHNKRKNHDNRHKNTFQLFTKYPVQPLLKLSRLSILIILKKAAGPG